MSSIPAWSSSAAPAPVERELRLVREAIAMVACGASPRVVVAGLRHGDSIFDASRRIALESGVRVNRLPNVRNSNSDLVVEPIQA